VVVLPDGETRPNRVSLRHEENRAQITTPSEPASPERACHRIRCATRSRRISSITARTYGWCSSCSAIRTSRPRRSTPTSRASGWNSCTRAITRVA